MEKLVPRLQYDKKSAEIPYQLAFENVSATNH